MSFVQYHEVENGDRFVYIKEYACDTCGLSIMESDRHLAEGENHYCSSCAFKAGKITSQKYLESCGVGLASVNATVRNGEIVIYHGTIPPWEQRKRETVQYKTWRNRVFTRDEYKCKRCGQTGGTLHAHHIKRYADYKDLRYEESNGETLCVSCHRKEHSKN